MRSIDATDATFEEMTSTGTVVIAFYWENDGRGRFDECRRALLSATWEHDKSIRIVFVEFEKCEATCQRLRVFGFPNFWLLKDGRKISERAGSTKSMQKYRKVAFERDREAFSRWLRKELPSEPVEGQ